MVSNSHCVHIGYNIVMNKGDRETSCYCRAEDVQQLITVFLYKDCLLLSTPTITIQEKPPLNLGVNFDIFRAFPS